MKVRAYHFVSSMLRDNSPIPPDGEWLEFGGQCIMCYYGLHASRHPLDALQYAPGATLCLVDCDGIADEQVDKLVCSRRRIVARFDATETLWTMARWSALQVLHLWDAPQVVRDYLTTGDKSLSDAARAAAWSVARSGAFAAQIPGAQAAAREAAAAAGEAAAAAGDAPGDAAWYAARAAARIVAWVTAWAAVGDESRDAAWCAAWDAQKTKFLALVTTAFAERGIEI